MRVLYLYTVYVDNLNMIQETGIHLDRYYFRHQRRGFVPGNREGAANLKQILFPELPIKL